MTMVLFAFCFDVIAVEKGKKAVKHPCSDFFVPLQSV